MDQVDSANVFTSLLPPNLDYVITLWEATIVLLVHTLSVECDKLHNFNVSSESSHVSGIENTFTANGNELLYIDFTWRIQSNKIE